MPGLSRARGQAQMTAAPETDHHTASWDQTERVEGEKKQRTHSCQIRASKAQQAHSVYHKQVSESPSRANLGRLGFEGGAAWYGVCLSFIILLPGRGVVFGSAEEAAGVGLRVTELS
ncbi:hypothetical protein AAFF_G00202070 [Aldrovandia affinis]|uniref:Uncharacterized protein n=1 Tax=Aldrovandia affinis TaxID=143900 RepID=A0AAD7SYU9_9TELE|nr:hypothetical protein AAFF_G00202070 [Aldrovandia affinis]